MTSEALTMAVTSAPGARPSSLAASTVIDATSRTPPAFSSTLAVASPRVIPVTVALIWLRADRRIVQLRFVRFGCCVPYVRGFYPVGAARRMGAGRRVAGGAAA